MPLYRPGFDPVSFESRRNVVITQAAWIEPIFKRHDRPAVPERAAIPGLKVSPGAPGPRAGHPRDLEHVRRRVGAVAAAEVENRVVHFRGLCVDAAGQLQRGPLREANAPPVYLGGRLPSSRKQRPTDIPGSGKPCRASVHSPRPVKVNRPIFPSK